MKARKFVAPRVRLQPATGGAGVLLTHAAFGSVRPPRIGVTGAIRHTNRGGFDCDLELVNHTLWAGAAERSFGMTLLFGAW